MVDLNIAIMDSLQFPQQSFDDSTDMGFEPSENNLTENFHSNAEDFSFNEDIKPIIGPRSAHQCNICNKIFVSIKGLQQHAVIHTDQKPFPCEICGKSFRFKSNLFEHKSVHSDFTAHACPFCGKTCRLKGNLKKHLKTHVSTKEELDEAWKPFASNRRPPAEVPADAVIVRSNGDAAAFTPTTTRPRQRKRKLGLGNDATTWSGKIKRGEILASLSVEEKIEQFRNALNILQSNGASLKAVLNKAKMIAFESFGCPSCDAKFTSRGECSEHLDTEHPLARVVRPLFCEICLKSFADQKTMEQHESYHKRVHLLVENGDLELTDPEPLIPNINDLPANVFDDEAKEKSSDQAAQNLLLPNSYDPLSQANGQTQNSASLPNQHNPSADASVNVYFDEREQISLDQLQASSSHPFQQNSYQAEDGQLF